MANIVILGAGVMGSALAVPAAAANSVTLIGSPLDDAIIAEINSSGRHPTLDVTLPENLTAAHTTDNTDAAFSSADVIVIGVSSPGVDWALGKIAQSAATPNILALVTKGLVAGKSAGAPAQTYAQYLTDKLTRPAGRIVGIGGPCIARELALQYPTRVSFAANDLHCANDLKALLQTRYYRITTHQQFTALEACAALKNFMCIGVSAMFSRYDIDGNHAKNPLAALFNQAVHEIALLSDWIVVAAEPAVTALQHDEQNGTRPPPAFDLAGMGDLHVTVGGGRNSRLGRYLGRGLCLQQILASQMQGVTVEGVDTGRQLVAGFRAACQCGDLPAAQLPLTHAILNAIEHNTPFHFDFTTLPG